MPGRRLGPLVVALLLVVGAPSLHAARADPPRTYAQLKGTLKQKSEDQRRKALRAFARDRRPALGERLKAASAYRRALDDDDKRVVRAWLLEAHLHGVAGATGLRRSALRRAKAAALATGQEDTARHIDAVLGAEKDLERLADLVRRNERTSEPRARTPDEDALVEDVLAAMPSWKALRDARGVAHARLWIARLDATTPGGEAGAARELSNLVRACGTDRDCAPLRAEVRRARARLLAKSGDWENAAHEMLVADRAALVPPALPRFEPPAKTPYTKTRETAELCFAAYQHGVSCGELERSRMGERSFYDFSREARAAVFDEERARMVALEYTPLVVDCLKQGVASGDTRDTTVELEWSIGHDGKVRRFQLNPRRLRGTPVERCLDGAFKVFRYPPYRGEMKHMGNRFTVGG